MNLTSRPLALTLLTSLILFSSMPQATEVDAEVAPVETNQREAMEPASGIPEKATEMVNDKPTPVPEALLDTQTRRAISDFFILANYSYFDLLIPSKYGFTLGYMPNANKTWELEYLRGSVSFPLVVKDLGGMTDERVSLIRRNYFGGSSFNFSYGLSYFDFSIHLGDKLLNSVTKENYPSVDVLEVQSLGFNIGIGNRWSFNHNITFGIDWITWSQPVYVIDKKSDFLDHSNNQNDKDDVDAALDIVSYFPRLTLLKLQLGILF